MTRAYQDDSMFSIHRVTRADQESLPCNTEDKDV
jgi:hypothetical protein